MYGEMKVLGPSGVELEEKFFWTWFICTLEGFVLLWLNFFSTKCLLRNTLIFTDVSTNPSKITFAALGYCLLLESEQKVIIKLITEPPLGAHK